MWSNIHTQRESEEEEEEEEEGKEEEESKLLEGEKERAHTEGQAEAHA